MWIKFLFIPILFLFFGIANSYFPIFWPFLLLDALLGKQQHKFFLWRYPQHPMQNCKYTQNTCNVLFLQWFRSGWVYVQSMFVGFMTRCILIQYDVPISPLFLRINLAPIRTDFLLKDRLFQEKYCVKLDRCVQWNKIDYWLKRKNMNWNKICSICEWVKVQSMCVLSIMTRFILIHMYLLKYTCCTMYLHKK